MSFDLTESTWLLLDRIGIVLGIVTGAATLLAFVIGYLKREHLRRWLIRNRFPAIGGALAEHVRYDGLVFTVSKAETPAWVLAQIKPKAAVFVVSEQSRGAVDELKAQVPGIASLSVLTVADVDDPADTRQAVRQAVEWLKSIGCTHIAVDVTGGKVPMSLGAFMAAEEMGQDSLYVSTRFDAQLNRPDMRTAKIVVVSRPVNLATMST